MAAEGVEIQKKKYRSSLPVPQLKIDPLILEIYCRMPARWGLQQTTLGCGQRQDTGSGIIRDRSLFMAGGGPGSNDFLRENFSHSSRDGKLSRPTRHCTTIFRRPLLV